MVLRTYLDKFNTIIKDSSLNTGFNQIAELIYGANNTRLLVHFSIDKLKEYVNKNNISDLSKMKHFLKITNCGFIDKKDLYRQEPNMYNNGVKLRASSFDLIFFLIPQEWDNGKGYDMQKNFFNQSYNTKCCDSINVDTSKLLSTDGSNWYKARNGIFWDEEGIYANETLSKEYDNFSSNEGSDIVIGRQKFDIGDENINVDLSEIVNKMINDEIPNYGIGIAFSPMMEINESENENYIGFFSPKTHTFFKPFLETKYDDNIQDDRTNFVLDKVNRLYLYANVDGFLTNLDEIPSCVIENAPVRVLQASEGVYYAEVKLSSKEYSTNTMYYDVWSNLKYNGEVLDDVEMEFVTKPKESFLNIGSNIDENKRYVPLLYGINDDEEIIRGDIRKIGVYSKNEYSRNKASILKDLYYRIYIKNGEDEIDIISNEKVNRTFNENYFLIDTEMLLPQWYYIDIMYKNSMEKRICKNVLKFKVVNDVTKE